MTTYTINKELNGIEVYFSDKPKQDIIATLKANGWRWHNVKKCWYNRNNETNLKTAESIIRGKEIKAAAQSNNTVKYSIQVSDYISLDEFKLKLTEYYGNPNKNYSQTDIDKYVNYTLTNYYNNEKEYYNLKRYIRQAIVWKSLGGNASNFYCNGDNAIYYAVWDKLPTIKLSKTGKVYSAMWGYDQTQITTATHYGKAFGLDVLVTGAFGSGKVLLKRIPSSGNFSDGCMYFTPNTFTEEEIQQTNEYASMYGR